MIYARLIAAVLQHWILLTATWCDCRRSLMKAAAIISDWVTLLTDALGDLDRLVALLRRLSEVIQRANARCKTATRTPASPNSYGILYFWNTPLKLCLWGHHWAAHPSPAAPWPVFRAFGLSESIVSTW